VRGRREEGSFALVSTLLIVAVMAMGALAFFQAARMDRLVSRNTADRVRAELAAESGLAAATALLRIETTNDTFVITLNPTNRQLFSGDWRGAGRGAGFAYRPLFSVSSDLEGLLVTPINSAGQPTTNLTAPADRSFTNPTAIFTNQLPGGLFVTSPVVSWVYLTNAQGSTNAKFAFWTEDLGGRIDLGTAGTTNIAAGRGQVPVSLRPTGTNAEEIALWSLFSPASASFLENTATALASNRSSLLTPASAALLSGTANPAWLGDVATGVIQDTNELEVVPQGLGYANAGTAKLNLNANLSAAGATAIGNRIRDNLPDFASTSRSGGMSPATYIDYLTANIVDYADGDSTPTTVNGQAGNEPGPWLNEIYDRIQWQGWEDNPAVVTAGRGQGYLANLTVETYAEFWNMTDQTVTNDLVLEVNATNQVLQNGEGTDVALAESPWTFTTTAVVFRPNEYRVLVFTNRATVFWGMTEPASNANMAADRYTMTYELRWNGVTVDNAPGGLLRTEATTGVARSGTSANFWRGNGMVTDSDLATNRCGDPRINRHLNRERFNHTYDANTSWGGRNLLAALTTRSFGEVKNWGDGTFITNSPAGITATSRTDLPTAAAARATYDSNAPARFNNSGLFSNICELGNIFDPIQWEKDGTGGPALIDGSAMSNALSGGGQTLRIGRAEHPRFTNNGLRASQLLDLFAVGPVPPGGGRGAGASVTNTIAGRINLNTATTNALRALAAGVTHRTDPALSPGGVGFVPTVTAVNDFINGVTNFRNQGPFLAPSQLAQITTTNGSYPDNAVFGSKRMGGAADVITEWSDAAAEEWFAKIYPLTTVRSRNFLIHVVGQALATNSVPPGRPLASVRYVYQVYLEPQRDTSGFTTNSIAKLLRTWSL